MKFGTVIAINAFVFIALGIAFALYGPLMINMYGVLEHGESAVLYWYSVSFARLYGAALFGFGFLLWALRVQANKPDSSAETKRGLLLSMVLANLLALIVSLTQQVSIWGTFVGWVTVGVYALLLVAYAYLLASKADLK